MKLKLNEDIRITSCILPNRSEVWIAEAIAQRRAWELERQTVRVIIEFLAPSSVGLALRRLVHAGVSVEEAEHKIAHLHDCGVLRKYDDDGNSYTSIEAVASNNVLAKWHEHGWVAASAYHRWCYDFPFHENDASGLQATRLAMQEYVEEEQDLERFKSYPEGYERLPLPSIQDCLKRGHPSDRLDRLLHLLTASFGISAKIPAPWGGAPLALRTSPSGGARHPTEAYLFSQNNDVLLNGWYHIQVDPLALVRLPISSPIFSAENAFPRHTKESGFKVSWFLVLTSAFSRNMYRYREARTFRSVHMDVGHVVTNIELLAEALGIKAFPHHGFRADALMGELNLDPTVESVQFVVGLG